MVNNAVLTPAQYHELLQYVPSWHACVLGPVPMGQRKRLCVKISNLVVETSDEALQKVWDHVVNLCEMWGVEFDGDAWELQHIRPENQS